MPNFADFYAEDCFALTTQTITLRGFLSENSMPEEVQAFLVGLLIIVLASSALYATTLMH
jgi:hypothetical protein